MSALELLLASGGGGGGKLYVDDVFSSYPFVPTGSAMTITNGIDLAGKGGMVWTKTRGPSLGNSPGAEDHFLCDTVRGVNKALSSNRSDAQVSNGISVGQFNSNGFLAPSYGTSYTGVASWTFRRAAKFFDIASYTGDGSTTKMISHSLGCQPGVIIIKRTDSTSDWMVAHRVTSGDSFTTSAGLFLNLTSASSGMSYDCAVAQADTASFTAFQHASATSDRGGNRAGASYVAYLFAHDTSADGIIQCGSYTGNGSAQTINLGWEPQFLLYKSSGAADNWTLVDVMRGYPRLNAASSTANLYPNLSNPESGGNYSGYGPEPNGFSVPAGLSTSGQVYIYMAIRRPNKPPTSGTQVYNAIARTGTGAAATVTGVGFAPDLVMTDDRIGYRTCFFDRLRGPSQYIVSVNSGAETDYTNSLTTFGPDGFSLGPDTSIGYVNFSGDSYINWAFKRAPGFMDVVCYNGTGMQNTVPHNLGVAPELIFLKARSGVDNWYVQCAGKRLYYEVSLLNSANAGWYDNTIWPAPPTVNSFTVGTTSGVNYTGATFVAYLFATLAGVSKVFIYTGNGGSQTINCGFSAGARFILIKRIDGVGDWFVWDSVRGIASGSNDLHLSLNTTTAEATGDNSVEPQSSGFSVNQNTATNINASFAAYIGLAIA